MYDAVSAEERGKPTVTLVNHGFVNDAESASRSKGFPMLRYISTTVPCESSIMEDIEAGIDGALDEIIAALTRPVSAEEKSPGSKEPEKPTRTVFKGSLEEVNRFFYQRG